MFWIKYAYCSKKGKFGSWGAFILIILKIELSASRKKLPSKKRNLNSKQKQQQEKAKDRLKNINTQGRMLSQCLFTAVDLV